MKGETGSKSKPARLTSTPLQFDRLHALLTVPSGLYQLMTMFASVSFGRIRFILARIWSGVSLSHTTATRAPQRVASAAAFQVKSIRPKSMIPRSNVRKTTATIANSTIAAPNCRFLAPGCLRRSAIASLLQHLFHRDADRPEGDVRHHERNERDEGVRGVRAADRHGDEVEHRRGALRRMGSGAGERVANADHAGCQPWSKWGAAARGVTEHGETLGDVLRSGISRVPSGQVPRCVPSGFGERVVLVDRAAEFGDAECDGDHHEDRDAELDQGQAALFGTERHSRPQ